MNALEMAKKMETDAIKFYTEAAGKTRYEAGKKMFLSITEDEKRHLIMIADLIKGMNITIQDVSPMKRVRSVFESMKSEMMKKVEASKDDLEAFKIAMEMEKEGKKFYEKSRDSAKTEKERALFARLVEEEKQHFKIFSNSYTHLADTGNWFLWEERGVIEG
jgi:rubrerythrin